MGIEIPVKIRECVSYESPVCPESLRMTKGFAKRFPKVKDRVLSILKHDTYARRNYLWLCMIYWSKCDQIKIIVPLEKFNEINSPETITRAFRQIMKDHREKNEYPFLKYDAVDELRQERAGEVKKYFHNQR